MAEHVLWIIEHPENGQQGKSPFYWGLVEGQQGWTPDIKDAFKFDTQFDAEKRADDVGIPDYRVFDHMWLDHRPTTNLDVV